MSQAFPALDSVAIEMSPATRERHLIAISRAIQETKPRRSRFRLMAVAVAVVFLLPVLALAAEDAQPGDLLYPVRQVLPWAGSDEASDPSGDDASAALVDRSPADSVPTDQPVPDQVRSDEDIVDDREPPATDVSNVDGHRDGHERHEAPHRPNRGDSHSKDKPPPDETPPDRPGDRP